MRSMIRIRIEGVQAVKPIPSKPEGSTWTDEQWSAISLHGDNILVAAAAGSGKTAVLVERIIRRISNEDNRIDVDRLLVATFTKAAASEMRQRIREALELELFRKPDSDHLRRQLALIPRAAITTLHSFCLEVIQRHFQRIRLDPAFRIANETEAALIRHDILEELFEEYYANSSLGSGFWTLVDSFGGERSDDELYKLVQRLYDFSRSHPFPEYWLQEMAQAFVQADTNTNTNTNTAALQSTLWYESLLQDVRMELRGVIGLLEQAMKAALLPAGPAPYVDNLQEDMVLVEYLLEVSQRGSWDHLYHAFQASGFSKLNACRGDEFDKELQEQVKGLREQSKKQLKDMKEQLFERPPEVYAEELGRMAPMMQTLVELVNDFAARYQAAKKDKGLLDFADLEHYCLTILSDPSSLPAQLVPSQAAMEYRKQFVEVLLDEYQDTNMVQEAIVSLLSDSDPGNRFMVGDVKQSIYRFRLAEPGLFLHKYKSFRSLSVHALLQEESELREGAGSQEAESCKEVEQGIRIDLARNFRSRREIVDGVNFIFKQLMNETVAEIAYDADAELIHGANYPQAAEKEVMDLSIEMMLLERPRKQKELTAADQAEHGSMDAADASDQFDEDEEEEGTGTDAPIKNVLEEAGEMETAELEARTIAMQINRLMGAQGNAFRVHDKKEGSRTVKYRDIVILLRATQQWTPIIMEQLRLAGIPAYADQSTGYFSATEVEVVLSLLKVIDNPLQDIPLAAVLRSPMFRLSTDEMARIRIMAKHGAYYEAVYAAVHRSADDDNGEADSDLRNKLMLFLQKLELWRSEARQGSLADLIWLVYRETGYYDLVGGLPGGVQRQANLRALYDRARQYEATSFRGLFRFLRFIERMQNSGGDLGTARALGEQEDVVRIMSIHRSKGLEFPVVFVAGLGKMFNQTDLNGSFLLHKQLGFGPRFTDIELRISYPALPALAIRRRMRMELLAEEMRILYVALTRAKEKLILLGTVKNLDKELQLWAQFTHIEAWNLPDYALARARTYLDWLGPALIRHPQAYGLRERAKLANAVPLLMRAEKSRWTFSVPDFPSFQQAAASLEATDGKRLSMVGAMEPVDDGSDFQDEARRRLQWNYPYRQAQSYFSKTSVSEMKRLTETALPDDRQDEREWNPYPFGEQRSSVGKALLRRPRFMQEKQVSPTERGTIYHALMQHLPITADISIELIQHTAERMVELELITTEQMKVINSSVVAAFFETALGCRMRTATQVMREVPFSFGLPVKEVYPDANEAVGQETILIQGVIDCLFAEHDGLVLLDYKTDAVHGSIEPYMEKYRLQIDLYAKAIEQIWKRPVKEKCLFFFDGAHMVTM